MLSRRKISVLCVVFLMVLSVQVVAQVEDTQNGAIDVPQPEVLQKETASLNTAVPQTDSHQLAVPNPEVVQTEEPQDVEKLSSDVKTLFDESSKEINHDFLYEMARYYQRLRDEQRVKLLQEMPEASRQLILDAQTSYNTFLEQATIGNGLFGECEILKKIIKKLSEDDATIAPQLESFLIKIEKLQGGLRNGSFDHLLGTDQTAQLLTMFSDPTVFLRGEMKKQIDPLLQSEAAQFTFDDLGEMLVLCQALENVQIFAVVKQNCSAYLLIKSVLEAVYQKNIKKITQLYLEYLTPLLDQVCNRIDLVCADLEHKLSLLGTGTNDDSIKEAYSWFLRELKSYRKTLTVFASLKDNATSFCADSRSIFTTILYSFDVYKNFFGFYKRDHDLGFLSTPNLLDMALRSAIAVWNLSLQNSDFSSRILFNTIQGNGGVSSLTKIDPRMLLVMVSPFFLGWAFLNPSFWHKKTPTSIKELSKIASAWLYYHVFWQNDNQTKKFWPADNKHLKAAMLHGIDEFNDYFFPHLHAYIRMYCRPLLVEQLEKYSVGVIKPELIGYLVETFVPLVLLQDDGLIKKIIDCKRSDVFDPGFFDQIWRNFNDGVIKDGDKEDILKNRVRARAKAKSFDKEVLKESLGETEYGKLSEKQKKDAQGKITEKERNAFLAKILADNGADGYKKHLTDDEKKFSPDSDRRYLPDYDDRYVGHEKINIKAYYVECRLIKYIFESMGERLGGVLTREYKGVVADYASAGFKKILAGLAWTGIIHKTTANIFDDAKAEFGASAEEILGILQFFLREVFNPSSPFRSMVLPLLEQLGEVSNSDAKDPLLVNQEILDFILNVLAQRGQISYIDAALIEKDFTGKPDEIEPIITRVINAVKSNIVASLGSKIGKIAGSFLGGVVMNNGPWYPTVKRLVTGG